MTLSIRKSRWSTYENAENAIRAARPDEFRPALTLKTLLMLS